MIKKTIRLFSKMGKWIGFTVIVFVVGSVVFTLIAPTFGGKPDASTQEKIARSKHHNGEKFVNITPVQVSTHREKGLPFLLKTVVGFIRPEKHRKPIKPLPTQDLQPQSVVDGSFAWLGHSTVLFRTGGKTMITDPVFHAAAPVPFMVKQFPMEHEPNIESLPAIDAVLISHDHYDHLDYQAIKKLKEKVAHFYVPLGIKAHLKRWGVSEHKITEMDWYEQVMVGDVRLVFTPTRHFSGRGLFNRYHTLWGSWVVQSPDLSVYFSGDGGYSSEFKKIGEAYGPFDIAFMEDGAYNEDWSQIHMMPEESAQAAVDLGVKTLLPIHWGKFDLSRHPWAEPAQRIADAVQEKNNRLNVSMALATPMIGEVFTLDRLPTSRWWEQL